METPIKQRGRPALILTNPPNRLREIRVEQGYSLAEFAELLGIKPPSLYQHETRGNVLSDEKIFLAAELLHTDPRYLDERLRLTAEKLALLSKNVSR